VNLAELRDAVRAQTDLEEDELDNARLDLYLRDAFNATIGVEREWPFFETSWEVTFAAGEQTAAVPADVAGLVSVSDVATRFRLHEVDHATAEDEVAYRLRDTTGVPQYYSMWGGLMYLWPATNEERTYRLRGWRNPNDWVSAGAAAEPDCDERMHIPLVYFACSLVYAQQEDEVLDAMYMNRFREALARAQSDIMRPPSSRPKVLSGGFRRRLGRRDPLLVFHPPSGG
jgi:hypothetical protein